MREQVTHSLPDTLGQCEPGTRVLIETRETRESKGFGYRVDPGTVIGQEGDGRIAVKMDHGVIWHLQPFRVLDMDRYVFS